MPQKDSIPLPEPVKAKAQNYLANISLAQQSFQIYLQGYIDSLHLKGRYTLDTNSWSLIPQRKEDNNAEENANSNG